MRGSGNPPARLQSRSIRTHWRFVAGLLVTLVWCMAAAVAARAQTPRTQTPALTIDSLTGRDSFDRYCASCHGTGGRGDGPLSSALEARPTDLTLLARRNEGAYPEARVRSVISGYGDPLASHGSSDMPVQERAAE